MNTAMLENTAMPGNTAMPANTAMPVHFFLRVFEGGGHFGPPP